MEFLVSMPIGRVREPDAFQHTEVDLVYPLEHVNRRRRIQKGMQLLFYGR